MNEWNEPNEQVWWMLLLLSLCACRVAAVRCGDGDGGQKYVLKFYAKQKNEWLWLWRRNGKQA